MEKLIIGLIKHYYLRSKMNIRNINIIVFIFCCLLLSCKQKDVVQPINTAIVDIDQKYENLDDIPLTTCDLPDFPFYLTLPANYHFDGSVSEMNFDEIYHFYPDSSTLSIGGKYYEAAILKNINKKNRRKNKDEVYEDSLLLNHFKEEIKTLGGIETGLPKKYSHMLHDSYQVVDSVKRYIIRTKKGNIWIDLISLHEPRQMNYSVIFEGSTSQPVSIIKAERLRYALENYGKVVVYVNFLEGKISLEPDGVKAVEEFVKLMNLDPDLRLSIEGHTDNIGSTEYDRRLSYERVVTIANFLKKNGIKEYRFTKVGHGSTHIVAKGNTNEAKAKNNRIELIKTNIDETGLRKAIDRDGKAVLQISFETGKYIIKPEGLDIVDQIAKLLKKDKKLKLSIEGHTDNAGSAIMNKKLSQDRANAVLNRLVELGIDRKRLKSVGYGLEKPIVPNNSEENKKQNRRVEIVKINQ